MTKIIGHAAVSLTALSFLPQAWQTFRFRSVSDISLGM
ncbi:MAG: PQ-loop domain-containing transporter [Hylemonella sp.]